MMLLRNLLLLVPALALVPQQNVVVPTKAAPAAPVAGNGFQKAVAAAVATASVNILPALAGGQAEGTGLTLGIDDSREFYVLAVVFAGFWVLYFNWAKDQPDNDSDFFAEYDERRA